MKTVTLFPVFPPCKKLKSPGFSDSSAWNMLFYYWGIITQTKVSLSRIPAFVSRHPVMYQALYQQEDRSTDNAGEALVIKTRLGPKLWIKTIVVKILIKPDFSHKAVACMEDSRPYVHEHIGQPPTRRGSGWGFPVLHLCLCVRFIPSGGVLQQYRACLLFRFVLFIILWGFFHRRSYNTNSTICNLGTVHSLSRRSWQLPLSWSVPFISIYLYAFWRRKNVIVCMNQPYLSLGSTNHCYVWVCFTSPSHIPQWLLNPTIYLTFKSNKTAYSWVLAVKSPLLCIHGWDKPCLQLPMRNTAGLSGWKTNQLMWSTFACVSGRRYKALRRISGVHWIALQYFIPLI